MSSMIVIDSHTGGEPTRTIISGGPNLGTGNMAERKQVFAKDFDHFRSALVTEPRGSDVMVGALICEPVNPDNAAGVIFFNNVGFLGMCGHGTIGVAVTLFHEGKIGLGKHIFETPVGDVTVDVLSPNRVSINNVASYRTQKDVAIQVPNYGKVIGDVVWGGNWFFLVKEHDQKVHPDSIDQLTNFCWQVRETLNQQKVTGESGAEIDHIELFTTPSDPQIADSQNFVLCPGREYDRSPCGTGTSAKVASLFEDGLLQEGHIWRQQSIIGSVFEASVKLVDGQIIPSISGTAYVNMRSEVLIQESDPFKYGF